MSLDRDSETEAYSVAITIAFACGLLTGAALGLLLAPAQGRDARAWVTTQGRSARRGAAAFLTRNQMIAIVRRDGVRGLLHQLRAAKVEPPLDA